MIYYFSGSPLFLIYFFIYLFNYVFNIHLFILNKLPEVPEYAKMLFHMMTLIDVMGKIAWVR